MGTLKMGTLKKILILNPKRFKIGEWVEVIADIEPAYDSYALGNRVIQRWGYSKKKRPKGQVVGIKRVCLGYCDRSARHDEQSFLEVKSTVRVWMVKRGMMNVPLLCLEKDMIPCEGKDNLPLLWQDRPEWSEKHREEMREYAKEMKRDKKGRFLP